MKITAKFSRSERFEMNWQRLLARRTHSAYRLDLFVCKRIKNRCHGVVPEVRHHTKQPHLYRDVTDDLDAMADDRRLVSSVMPEHENRLTRLDYDHVCLLAERPE